VLQQTFPGKEGVWREAARLEKAQGGGERLDALLKRAVTYCPRAEVLWLMAAKEKWVAGDVPGARGVLAEAFAANPDSEAIWLAAFKLEFENSEPERARALLAKVCRERVIGFGCLCPGGGIEGVWLWVCETESTSVYSHVHPHPQPCPPSRTPPQPLDSQPRHAHQPPKQARETESCSTARVWMKSAIVEREAGDGAAQRSLLEEGLRRHPAFWKLWLMLGQLEEREGRVDAARTAYAAGGWMRRCIVVLFLFRGLRRYSKQLQDEYKDGSCFQPLPPEP